MLAFIKLVGELDLLVVHVLTKRYRGADILLVASALLLEVLRLCVPMGWDG